MPRYLVSLEGPEALSASDVQGTLQHMLPADTGWEVAATSMEGTVFASVSVFDAGMTEISRGVQELLPTESDVTFVTKHVHNENGTLVEYQTETRFTRTRAGALQPARSDEGIEWSPAARRNAQ